MLNFRELAALGFCPTKGYGWMKAFPPGFKLPAFCAAAHFKQLPLQIQIFYQIDAKNGQHKLTHQLR